MLREDEIRKLAPSLEQIENQEPEIVGLDDDYIERKRLSFQAKQERKIERFTVLSEKNQNLSRSLFERADKMASIIPVGQPILLGHHSERGDRRYRERIRNCNKKASDAFDKAKYYERKAESVGDGGISSDDPDAIFKLEEKLRKAEAFQDQAKRINAAIRKLLRKNQLNFESLKKLLPDFKDSTLVTVLKPDSMGEYGIPSYSLTNRSAKMRRIRQRIEELKKKASREVELLAKQGEAVTETTKGSVTIRENFEENRLQVLFSRGKPVEEVRKYIRKLGFIYSPTHTAWQRRLKQDAKYHIKSVLDGLERIAPELLLEDFQKH